MRIESLAYWDVFRLPRRFRWNLQNRDNDLFIYIGLDTERQMEQMWCHACHGFPEGDRTYYIEENADVKRHDIGPIL